MPKTQHQKFIAIEKDILKEGSKYKIKDSIYPLDLIHHDKKEEKDILNRIETLRKNKYANEIIENAIKYATKINFLYKNHHAGGYYWVSDKEIGVDVLPDNCRNATQVLLHELIHIWQLSEGFFKLHGKLSILNTAKWHTILETLTYMHTYKIIYEDALLKELCQSKEEKDLFLNYDYKEIFLKMLSKQELFYAKRILTQESGWYIPLSDYYSEENFIPKEIQEKEIKQLIDRLTIESFKDNFLKDFYPKDMNFETEFEHFDYNNFYYKDKNGKYKDEKRTKEKIRFLQFLAKGLKEY